MLPHEVALMPSSPSLVRTQLPANGYSSHFSQAGFPWSIQSCGHGCSPIEFWMGMGFRNTMTLATMTATRLTQLPMECVTGDTRWRIM